MEGTLIADRYRLEEQIGSGGEARIFRARDLREGSTVAIRVPVRKVEEATVAPLEKSHPGWVQLLETGCDADQGAYEVFELLEGETLRQKVEKKPLEGSAWNAFVKESLEAVRALHEAGWVHGDLNADNFLEVATSSGWKLLELPFGKIAVTEKRSTMFGSIHTLAPEQAEGKPPDFRSDLYALGCLYYFAAAGEFPHAGINRQEIVVSLLRFTPHHLRERCPELDLRADWVMRLLERDPARRFESAQEALRSWLALEVSGDPGGNEACANKGIDPGSGE